MPEAAARIADGRAAAVFAPGFDLHIHLLRGQQIGTEQRSDGDGVMYRRAGIAKLAVETVEEFQPVRHHTRHGVGHGADAAEIFGKDQSFFGHVQSGHPDGNAGAKHDVRRLRVHQNVEFRGAGPVAVRDAAAHQTDAGNLRLQLRMRQQERGDIGQRPRRDDAHRAFAFAKYLCHQLHGAQPVRLHDRLRQRGAVQPGRAVNGRRVHGRGKQRRGPPLSDRAAQSDQGAHAQGVVGGLFNGLIAADGGNGADVQKRAGVCQHPRDGVVMAGISVENDRKFFKHGSVLSGRELSPARCAALRLHWYGLIITYDYKNVNHM